MTGTEKQQELFNQSYKVKITPMVIYLWSWGHTHRHTYIHMKVISRNQAHAWFKNKWDTKYCANGLTMYASDSALFVKTVH